MGGGRRKLTGLVWTAVAAKQPRSSLLSSIYRSPSPLSSPLAQHRLFSSWLDCNLDHQHPPVNPSCFTLGAAHLFLITSPHEPVQFAGVAAASTSSSYKNPLFSSPSLSQSAYCASFAVPSLLCISGAETDRQNHVLEPSTKGESCHSTCVREDDRSSKHQRNPWGSPEIVNWPNAISFGRLLSGPLLAWLILEGLLKPAVVGLIVSGASDWFDGYIARRKGIDSVFGTYLDPLADKVLIGCVAISMAQAGYLPWALVGLVIARDTALIAGSCVIGARSLKWKVTSIQDLFNTTKGSAQKVEPLYISKINTVFQLALIGVALLQPAFGVEDSYSLIPLLTWCVVFTTCTSFMGYGWKLFQQFR